MLNKILWYLIRPKYYTQFIFLIVKKINLKFRGKRIENNLQWCISNAITTNDAILKITGTKIDQKVSDIYSDIFHESNKKIKKCPVKMGGSANIDLLYYLCEYLKAKKVLETGVAYGWSTLSILLSINKRNNSKLVSTDMPYPGLDDSYVGLVIPEKLKEKWTIIKDAPPFSIFLAWPKNKCATKFFSNF